MKQKGRSMVPCPSPEFSRCPAEAWKYPVLELELHAEAQRRRELEDRARAIEWIRLRINSRRSTIDQDGFILTDGALGIQHIEPIQLQTQLAVLAHLDRVVRAQVQVIGDRRTITAGKWVDGRTTRHATKTRNAEAFVVAIQRVRN